MPHAGLTPKQTADLYAMLQQANTIVQQQRSQVQDALLRWRRSSGGGSAGKAVPGSPDSSSAAAAGFAVSSPAADAAVVAASSAESKLQLVQLQQEQDQLLAELGKLRKSFCDNDNAPTSPPGSLALTPSAAAGGASGAVAGEETGGALVAVPTAGSAESVGPQLSGSAQPEDVTAFVNSLANRLMQMQAITQHIVAEVQAKHVEATALQESFAKVGCVRACMCV